MQYLIWSFPLAHSGKVAQVALSFTIHT